MKKKGFPYQEEVNEYYDKKKIEVQEWLINTVNGLRWISVEQRETLMSYAAEMSFRTAGDVNVYVQGLKTISKRDKAKIWQYLSDIEWLPEGITVGKLDGELVVRMVPNQLDLMLQQQKRKEDEGSKE